MTRAATPRSNGSALSGCGRSSDPIRHRGRTSRGPLSGIGAGPCVEDAPSDDASLGNACIRCTQWSHRPSGRSEMAHRTHRFSRPAARSRGPGSHRHGSVHQMAQDRRRRRCHRDPMARCVHSMHTRLAMRVQRKMSAPPPGSTPAASNSMARGPGIGKRPLRTSPRARTTSRLCLVFATSRMTRSISPSRSFRATLRSTACRSRSRVSPSTRQARRPPDAAGDSARGQAPSGGRGRCRPRQGSRRRDPAGWRRRAARRVALPRSR